MSRYAPVLIVFSVIVFSYLLYLKKEWNLIPVRIAKSDETMLKTDSMRHVFKVSLLCSRAHEAYLNYLHTGNFDQLSKATNSGRAAIGFASSALSDDRTLLAAAVPLIRRNVDISSTVSNVEEAVALLDEYSRNMSRIHRQAGEVEQEIWTSFQKDFVRFQTNEKRAAIAYQFSAALAVVVLLIVGFFFLRKRALLRVIETRERDLGQMVDLRNGELKILRRTQAAAEAADRAKTEFLALMSHELRTPLNAILGFSEIVKSGDKRWVSEEKTTEYASAIHSASLHLLNVINDILDLAKIESGEIELSESRVELASVIERAVGLIRQRSKEKQQVLSVEVDVPSPILIGDERLILQILINILSNAVKFTDHRGQITVFVCVSPSGGLDVGVRDNGVGIAPENIGVVMQPFGQLRSNSAVTHEGTGLGLPLTGRFAELHGASVEIESALAEGTTVTVRFPPDRIEKADALEHENTRLHQEVDQD